jgi:hypothetical protein
MDEGVARLVRDHGSWRRIDASLELLLVCLADSVWKDKRRVELEQLVVDRIAGSTGEAAWAVFAELDEQLTEIGSLAVQRLAYQNRHGVRQSSERRSPPAGPFDSLGHEPAQGTHDQTH